MGNETRKALPRRARDPLWVRILSEPGRKLDIGGGQDGLPGAENWELQAGLDGSELTGIPDGSVQLVYSSHCLEHLEYPMASLGRWWNVLQPGGWLWIEVPDAALYEHWVFPSRFNSDHKWLFSAYRYSDHARHINLASLAMTLKGAELWRCQTIDTNFDYSLPDDVDQTCRPPFAECACELVLRKLP